MTASGSGDRRQSKVFHPNENCGKVGQYKRIIRCPVKGNILKVMGHEIF